MKKVLVIVGPTASGKSDLAVKLAKKFKGEVISADSRQVYKGLDVGTGKVTRREMRGVPHYLLDIADPKRQVTANDYAHLARWSIRWIEEKGKLPILVGGTGFYIDAVTGAAALPDVSPNPVLRRKLNKLSAEKLFEMLSKKDPARAKTIDRHNKVRLVRALEIIDELGKVPAPTKTKSDFNFVFIGLKPEQKDLESRIYKRLLKRLPGIIREVKKLHANGLSWKRMYELGLEYRYVSLFVQGKLNKSEMVSKLNTEIKHYAKRQITWLKRNKKINWFAPNEFKKVEKYARMALYKGL